MCVSFLWQQWGTYHFRCSHLACANYSCCPCSVFFMSRLFSLLLKNYILEDLRNTFRKKKDGYTILDLIYYFRCTTTIVIIEGRKASHRRPIHRTTIEVQKKSIESSYRPIIISIYKFSSVPPIISRRDRWKLVNRSGTDEINDNRLSASNLRNHSNRRLRPQNHVNFWM